MNNKIDCKSNSVCLDVLRIMKRRDGKDPEVYHKDVGAYLADERKLNYTTNSPNTYNLWICYK